MKVYSVEIVHIKRETYYLHIAADNESNINNGIDESGLEYLVTEAGKDPSEYTHEVKIEGIEEIEDMDMLDADVAITDEFLPRRLKDM